MLDQLHLLDEMAQIGFVARNSVTFKDGQRVTDRGWHKMFQRMDGTYLKYCLNIRQKYSERIIGDAYLEKGGSLKMGWELKEMSVDEDAGDKYCVNSRIQHATSGEVKTVKRFVSRLRYPSGDRKSSLTSRIASTLSAPTEAALPFDKLQASD